MRCINCGAELSDENSIFCEKCYKEAVASSNGGALEEKNKQEEETLEAEEISIIEEALQQDESLEIEETLETEENNQMKKKSKNDDKSKKIKIGKALMSMAMSPYSDSGSMASCSVSVMAPRKRLKA